MKSTITKLHQPCPYCPSSDAYCEYEDGHSYCFSCKTYNGKTLALTDFHYEYLPWRGVNESTMEFYGVKTKVDSEGKPISIGYPYPENNVKVRLLDSKDFYWSPSGGASGLFGRNKFAAGAHKYITITEGELDALSLYQVLHSPVVSVQSASSAGRDAASDRSWLNSYERVYLAFDSDGPGREAAAMVARLFDYNKVYAVKFSNRKDANEYLQAGEGQELLNIWWNSKRYLPENIVSSFSEFSQILKEPPQRGVSYPWPTLTEMTYGLRPGESVLLTAQEGVGKTELMHAIEHHLLKETDSAVGAIFLEEPKQRHLQSIAGIELRKPVHLPDSGCTPVETVAALESVISQDERLHLYSHFGSDDPEVLLDTIRFLVSARSCRYVLLDHISMVVSGLAGEDERRALDYVSTRLEMMVKELNFSLIMVSHVNDEGKTRGSRYISKIADIRIDAERDIQASTETARNTTLLSISKNRYSGKTGPAGSLSFDPSTWCYTELGGWDNGPATTRSVHTSGTGGTVSGLEAGLHQQS